MVFQAPCLFHWLRALENVVLGLTQAMPKASAAEGRERAGYYLGRVGLGDALNKRPSELSAGMRQRVGLVLDDQRFYDLRERLIGFLEGQADQSATALPKASARPPTLDAPGPPARLISAT